PVSMTSTSPGCNSASAWFTAIASAPRRLRVTARPTNLTPGTMARSCESTKPSSRKCPSVGKLTALSCSIKSSSCALSMVRGSFDQFGHTVDFQRHAPQCDTHGGARGRRMAEQLTVNLVEGLQLCRVGQVGIDLDQMTEA